MIPSGLAYVETEGILVPPYMGSQAPTPFTPGGTPTNPVWNFDGPLQPGDSITISFSAHVAAEGEHENCAKVQAKTDDGEVVNSEDCAVVVGITGECEPKMHYAQYPDEHGWDVYSCKSGSLDEMIQLADDWKCSESGPVTDIRFWGSWKDDAAGQITGFWVEIYSNDVENEYSQPGELIWRSFFTNFTSELIEPGCKEGWYNPYFEQQGYEDWHDVENHDTYYRYDITDIEEPFYQEEGIIYWLSVYPVIDGGEEWGWKSSEDHWMDDACWSVHLLPDPQDPVSQYSEYEWYEAYEPSAAVVQSLDLAFIICGGELPCQCGDWGEVEVMWTNESQQQISQFIDCQSGMGLSSIDGETITVDAGISCSSSCEENEPSAHWQVTGYSSGYTTEGSGLEAQFEPEESESYLVEFNNVTCDGVQCEDCYVTLRVTLVSLCQGGSEEQTVCWRCDEFNSPPETDNSPSQDLLAWINANYNPDNDYFNPPNPQGHSRLRPCDDETENRFWAHTFAELELPDSCHIVSATLEITVENRHDNDHLKIGCIGSSNDTWEVNKRLTYFGMQVGQQGTITLDLSDVYGDGTTNLLDVIENEGFLDVAVDDDSPVDCARLIITYGP